MLLVEIILWVEGEGFENNRYYNFYFLQFKMYINNFSYL